MSNHHALVFAATGAISQAVARSHAERGHTLWLSAHTERVHEVAASLGLRSGGQGDSC